jgi:hypothetical protein
VRNVVGLFGDKGARESSAESNECIEGLEESVARASGSVSGSTYSTRRGLYLCMG